MSDEYISDDGPGSDLFDPYETRRWKYNFNQELKPTDQPCPKCNGDGYVVIRIYPWDGCSYDEEPCELCNSGLDRSELADKTVEEIDQTSQDVDNPFWLALTLGMPIHRCSGGFYARYHNPQT